MPSICFHSFQTYTRISAYVHIPYYRRNSIAAGPPNNTWEEIRLISYVASECQVQQHSHTTTLERSVINQAHLVTLTHWLMRFRFPLGITRFERFSLSYAQLDCFPFLPKPYVPGEGNQPYKCHLIYMHCCMKVEANPHLE